MTPICALDTETTGLHPNRQVWEVALIRRDDNGEKTSHFFVDVDLSDAEPMALKIGRFYERHPLGRYLSGRVPAVVRQIAEVAMLTPAVAALEVARFTHDATIVGAVPNFDTELLATLLRNQQLALAWRHRLRCVETLVEGHLRREIQGLREAAEAVGVEVVEADRHTALGDARLALAVRDRVMTDA